MGAIVLFGGDQWEQSHSSSKLELLDVQTERVALDHGCGRYRICAGSVTPCKEKPSLERHSSTWTMVRREWLIIWPEDYEIGSK